MSSQIDYQVLLETIVMTAKNAAQSAKERKDEAMLFAYYDILQLRPKPILWRYRLIKLECKTLI